MPVQNHRQIEESIRITRLDIEGSAERFLGLSGARRLLERIGQAQIDPKMGLIRMELAEAPVSLRGARELAQLSATVAQSFQVSRLRMVPVHCELKRLSGELPSTSEQKSPASSSFLAELGEGLNSCGTGRVLR
jgi:hypothetical protein